MFAFLIAFGKSQAARRTNKECAAGLQELKTHGRDFKWLPTITALVGPTFRPLACLNSSGTWLALNPG
jgi:hypothetical protein